MRRFHLSPCEPGGGDQAKLGERGVTAAASSSEAVTAATPPPSRRVPQRAQMRLRGSTPAAQGRRRLGLSAALAASALLAGCVSLLPKQPPAQLYQFGQTPPPASSTSGSVVGRDQADLGVILSQVTMPRAALDDGILTVRGDQAAYIAGARWLTPAVLMFQEDVQNAFAARAPTVRLIARGQLGAATALLRLAVTEFDARYDAATGGPPTIVVSLRATLTRADGRELVQQVFTERRPASQDRVAAIVQAYDAAVQGVMATAVDWTQAETPVIAAGLDPSAATALPPPPPRAFRKGLPQ